MKLRTSTTMTARTRGGFTLIELLAVIVILTILMAFLVPKLMGAEDVVKAENTRAFMLQVQAVLAEYENETGDYPRSDFTAEMGSPPNTLNLGAEALVAHLWSERFDGLGLSDDRLVNTDGDSAPKRITTLGNRQLFELRDDWDNPISYLHRRDYGRVDTYVTIDPETGVELDQNQVRARMNDVTDRYENPKTYQLVSPGEDGLFGTEDDITP